MTLRLRLAALTTVLLAIVLAVSGAVLERFMARDLERSLEKRARDRTRAPLPGPSTPGRTSSDPPPPGDDPDDPDAPPPPPPPPPPRPDDVSSTGPSIRALVPEPDGATVHVFRFQMPSLGAKLAPLLEARGSSGILPPPEAEARRRAATLVEDDAERYLLDGTTWVVALQSPPAPDGAGPPRAAPPRPRFPGMGDRVPNDPPPPPRRTVMIAFLDAGPAHEAHRGFVLRIAAIGLGALALGGLLAYALAGRMLRPVGTAARAAEAIERPTQRLPAPAAQDELGRLVNVLNGMLARLEAASDRERLFLATASHELRRPLTALLGELELASAQGRSAADLRGSLALARDDAKAMGRLVDDILHHAKAQAGTLRLVETESSLEDLVREAVTRSRRSLARPLEAELGGVPPLVVRGDADLLRRALENLVVNAAMHGGDGVRVTIGGSCGADGLALHVDDDGPGVPAEEQATIFDPFGRGDRARTVPGFGLGLAIARDVARAHGGDLTVVSPRPDGDAAHPGSRFTLRLSADRLA